MWRTTPLALIPSVLRLEMVVPVRVPSIGQKRSIRVPI